MAALNINHQHVSTKPDSADSSLVSSSEWNAPLVATSGAHNQIVVRDGGSATGLGLIDGPGAAIATESHSGAGPTPELADTVVTLTTSGFVLLFVTVRALVSDSSTVTVFVKRNGAVIDQYTVPGTGFSNCQAVLRLELAGSYTYTVACGLGSGTFTSVTGTITYLKLGTL